MNESATIDLATATQPKLEAFDGAAVLPRGTDLRRGDHYVNLRRR
ncbi:hypothetical protein ACFPFP_21970 [Bradyrhizobium sp. GCM10023182]|nr:hypothetical protein [Bradyrhizobium zhengyangense]